MSVQISPSELAAQLKSPHPPRLLDVREEEEHRFVALPNSVLLPLGQLVQRHGELADWRDEEIVVYCHHGIRSLNAVHQLRSLGFRKVRNLSGGIDQWAREMDVALPRY